MSTALETIDLEINNYELADILNLFKLPVMFDEKHLKQAKMIVLQMHQTSQSYPRTIFYFSPKRIRYYMKYIKFVSQVRKVIRKTNFRILPLSREN